MAKDHLAVGRLGEEQAANWYTEHGYRVLARNWRCAVGEIDLVCCRDDMLVICEVKTRRSLTHGAPYEAVTLTKQRRLRHLAAAYLAAQRPHCYYEQIRFDVASILGRSLDVIESAF